MEVSRTNAWGMKFEDVERTSTIVRKATYLSLSLSLSVQHDSTFEPEINLGW